MKTQFVMDIKERDLVESVFLVHDRTTAMAKNGKPYMTVRLMDNSGEIEGRIWDRVEEWESCFRKDDFIWVQGRASRYMGKMQLVIMDLHRLDVAEVNLEDFLPVTPKDRAALERELAGWPQKIADPHYRALLQAIFEDPDLKKRFVTAPAAKSMHHVYVGGLLEHSLSVASLAEDISGRYAGIDHDLLVTAALLHDVGKTVELSYSRSFDYTDEGKLLGHIVIGTEMVAKKIGEIPGFPLEKAILIKHLLVSHHGQYDFGSPKRPKTLEAVILNMVDDLDAKINAVQLLLASEAGSNESWTSYHRLLERYFFKGFGPETISHEPFSGSVGRVESVLETSEDAFSCEGCKAAIQEAGSPDTGGDTAMSSPSELPVSSTSDASPKAVRRSSQRASAGNSKQESGSLRFSLGEKLGSLNLFGQTDEEGKE
jgi:3'-5' exoribonuclease